jgi:hypothetical protein
LSPSLAFVAVAAVVIAAPMLCACGSTSATADVDGGESRLDGSLISDAEGGAPIGPDAACFIDPSNYDRSCSTDSDCTEFIPGVAPYLGLGGLPVQAGDYCVSMCLCRSEPISSKGAVRYWADVSKTPLGSGALPPQFCGCPASSAPCCHNGTCVNNLCLDGISDASASQQDASEPIDGSVLCGLHEGPLDAGTSGDPSRWCTPVEQCIPFNGGWACCTSGPGGGVTTCAAPVAGDAGQ